MALVPYTRAQGQSISPGVSSANTESEKSGSLLIAEHSRRGCSRPPTAQGCFFATSQVPRVPSVQIVRRLASRTPMSPPFSPPLLQSPPFELLRRVYFGFKGVIPRGPSFQLVVEPQRIVPEGPSDRVDRAYTVVHSPKTLPETLTLDSLYENLLKLASSQETEKQEQEEEKEHEAEKKERHRPRSPTGLLQQIYSGYEARDPHAFYHALARETPEIKRKLEQFFRDYGVPLVRPPSENATEPQSPIMTMDATDIPHDHLESICAAGMRCINHMRQDCKQQGSNIELDHFVLFRDLVAEVEDLKRSCKKLEYLLRTGNSPLALRARMHNLLESMRLSPVLKDIDLLPSLGDFTALYCKFCELVLTGEDTEATIRDLRDLVKKELEDAKRRVKDFDSVRKQYADRRRDLSAFLLANLQAARKSGFREGVSSEEEAQQVYDELENVDNRLARISEQLTAAKIFWEDAAERINSAPSTPAQAKDPPDGVLLESQASDIHTRLQSIHQAAEQYTGSRSVLKAGDYLIRKASKLKIQCTDMSVVQTSIQSQFQGQLRNAKAARKVVAPLTKGISRAIRGYEKVSQRWAKYLQHIYLLFWFARTTVDEQRRVERPDHVADSVLFSQNLCSLLFPLESGTRVVVDRLHRIQKFWDKMKFVDDVRFRVY